MNQKRAGDIVFVKTKTPFGWLVRFFTGSNWNHVYILVHERIDMPGEWMKLEANGLSVRLTEENTRFVKEMVALRPEFSNAEIGKALHEMTFLVGARYGWGQILGFAWILFNYGILGRFVRNPVRGGWNCSELAGVFPRKLGAMIWGNEWKKLKDSVTPGMLYDKLRKDKRFVTTPSAKADGFLGHRS